MKRYDFKAHFDPYYGCDVAEPEDCSDGDWVPASVAQALYDALKVARKSLATYGEHPIIDDRIDKAISLADGEE